MFKDLEKQLCDWENISRFIFLIWLVRCLILHSHFSAFSEFLPFCAVLSFVKLSVPYQHQLNFTSVLPSGLASEIMEGTQRKIHRADKPACYLGSIWCFSTITFFWLLTICSRFDTLHASGIVVQLTLKDFVATFKFFLNFFSSFTFRLLCERWCLIGISVI